jgi:hypothetical protein
MNESSLLQHSVGIGLKIPFNTDDILITLLSSVNGRFPFVLKK